MELLLATQRLAGPGGVQTYLLTVAPHLERLGHQVTLHAEDLGTMAEVARERGLRVAGEDELPERCDACSRRTARRGYTGRAPATAG